MESEKKLVLGNMYLSPASRSRDRAEAAMPGTRAVVPLLELEPPPIDRQAARPSSDSASRDYGPDPIAEYSLTVPAGGVFPTAGIVRALAPDLRRLFREPTFYVRTPAGGTTYMQSGDAPTEAVALVLGWSLREDVTVDQIAAGIEELGRWLASRPEGFAACPADRATIARQHARASRILSVTPDCVSIVVWPSRPDDRFDGKKLWRTLHAIGLRWGDGDQFHWVDPSGQTDHWFSAEVDDGQLGYALPEEIAAGRQHFDVIHFGFTVPRTPHPAHVLQQMIRAAQTAALELDARMAPCIDGAAVDSMPALAMAVQLVVEQLASLDLKPGAHSVCRLR